MTTENSIFELMQELIMLMRDPDIKKAYSTSAAKSKCLDGKAALTYEECVTAPQNTPSDLHVIGNNDDWFSEKNKTTVLKPNSNSFNDGLETNEFTNEEHVEGSFSGCRISL